MFATGRNLHRTAPTVPRSSRLDAESAAALTWGTDRARTWAPGDPELGYGGTFHLLAYDEQGRTTLGLGAALPAQTETGGHTGGFGRGERI